MSEDRASALIEEISSTVVMFEPDDAEAAENLSNLFEQLVDSLTEDAEDEVVKSVIKCQEIIEGLKGKKPEETEEDMEKLYQSISLIQRRIESKSGKGSGSPAEGGSTTPEDKNRDEVDRDLELPDWVDEDMFQEFISSQKALLQEVETELLELENGDDVDIANLKGKIHTMKGDTGMVGLDDMGMVYHAMEDYFLATGCAREGVDVLLTVKDWLGETIESYKKYKNPSRQAGEIIDMLNSRKDEISTSSGGDENKNTGPGQDGTGEEESSAKTEEAGVTCSREDSSAEPEEKDQTPSPPEKVTRDEETIALIEDFIQESEEGLTSTDEILLDIENNASDPEMINTIFRAFHTIKGVAGFLDFEQIKTLSHKTETMLNKVRDGELKLKGRALDAIFDSTEMMRLMIENVKSAVENSESVTAVPNLNIMISQLETIISGEEGSGSADLQKTPSGYEEDESAEYSGPAAIGSENKKSKKKVKIKEYLRVNSQRLDELVDTIGELVISESMVFQSEELQEIASPTLQKRMVMLDKITRQLQGMGTSLKMIPVKGIFQKMARLVRDLSRKSGKQVTMEMKGKDTELDKSVVDKIGDPLVHMIRNAVDHGIEPAEERIEAGKPESGNICLSAYHKGGYIYIEVKDDGRGLDRESIISKAINRGLISENHSLGDREIFNLIFEPGFSTAKKVTEVSGRGVGMDVVRRNIEALRGRVDISSKKGEGSVFTIRLPLTMAIIDGMVVRVGSESYIIPTLSIDRSIRPDTEDIVSVFNKGEMIRKDGRLIEIFRLHRFFNIDEAVEKPSEGLIVIVEDNGKKTGILVDELVGQQQIVIKSLSESMGDTDGISGATIMPDGTVGLILDTSKITKLFSGRGSANNTEDSPSEESPGSSALEEGKGRGNPQAITI